MIVGVLIGIWIFCVLLLWWLDEIKRLLKRRVQQEDHRAHWAEAQETEMRIWAGHFQQQIDEICRNSKRWGG